MRNTSLVLLSGLFLLSLSVAHADDEVTVPYTVTGAKHQGESLTFKKGDEPKQIKITIDENSKEEISVELGKPTGGVTVNQENNNAAITLLSDKKTETKTVATTGPRLEVDKDTVESGGTFQVTHKGFSNGLTFTSKEECKGGVQISRSNAFASSSGGLGKTETWNVSYHQSESDQECTITYTGESSASLFNSFTSTVTGLLGGGDKAKKKDIKETASVTVKVKPLPKLKLNVKKEVGEDGADFYTIEIDNAVSGPSTNNSWKKECSQGIGDGNFDESYDEQLLTQRKWTPPVNTTDSAVDCTISVDHSLGVQATMSIGGTTYTRPNQSASVKINVKSSLPASIDLETKEINKNEGKEGESTQYSFPLKLVGFPRGEPTTITYDIKGEGLKTTDFDGGKLKGIELTLPGTADSGNIDVGVVGNDIVELHKTFTVVITSVSEGVILKKDGVAKGLITNDDLPTLSIAAGEAKESDGAVILKVELDQALPTDDTITYLYTVTKGDGENAVSESDFKGSSFPKGNRNYIKDDEISIPIENDDLVEEDETFTVTLELTASTKAQNIVKLGNVSATGTILNDDLLPLEISSRIEGPTELKENSGKPFNIIFSLNQPAPKGGVNIDYEATEALSSEVEGQYFNLDDLENAQGKFTIAEGEKSYTLSLKINNDNVYEGDEQLVLLIKFDKGKYKDYTPSTEWRYTPHYFAIDDDDTPVISIAGKDEEKDEDKGPFTFTAKLSTKLTSETKVSWSVTGSGDNPADADDFEATQGSVTIPAGQTEQSFEVNIKNDDAVEEHEKFTVTLTAPSGIQVANNTATATIINKAIKQEASAEIGTPESNEGNSDNTTVSVNIALLGDDGNVEKAKVDTTLSYSVISKSEGLNASDFVDNALPSGKEIIRKGEPYIYIKFEIKADTDIEKDEKFEVHVSDGDPNDGVEVTGSGVGFYTILNDDYCAENTCKNGGQCSSDVNNKTFICACKEGFIGLTCEEVANKPPVVNKGIDPQTATEGTPFKFSISADTFNDPDDDPLLITVDGLPSSLSFERDGSVISGTPNKEDIKEYTITVKAEDYNNGGEVSTTFKLTVKSKPASTSTVVKSEPKNQCRQVEDTWCNGDDDADGIPNCEDGCPFNDDPACDACSVDDDADGIPNCNDACPNNSDTKCTDPTTKTVCDVVNIPPVVKKKIEDQTKTIGESFSIDAYEVFSDADDDELTVTLTGQPNSLRVNRGAEAKALVIAAGSFVPGDLGEHTITVTAKDRKGGEVSTTFKLTVKAKTAETNELTSCPAGQIKCSDGSCKATAAECSTTTTNTCPAAAPIRCSDGSCKLTQTECGTTTQSLTSNTCVAPNPHKCPDGSCKADAAACGTATTGTSCPATAPIKCPDGSCKLTQVDCGTSTQSLSSNICVAPNPHKCPDGTCKTDAAACTVTSTKKKTITTGTCPAGEVKCSDGSCVVNAASCPKTSTSTDSSKKLTSTDSSKKSTDSNVVKKIVSVSSTLKEFTVGKDKEVGFTISLSCPTGTVECSASTCAKAEACPKPEYKPKKRTYNNNDIDFSSVFKNAKTNSKKASSTLTTLQIGRTSKKRDLSSADWDANHAKDNVSFYERRIKSYEKKLERYKSYGNLSERLIKRTEKRLAEYKQQKKEAQAKYDTAVAKRDKLQQEVKKLDDQISKQETKVKKANKLVRDLDENLTTLEKKKNDRSSARDKLDAAKSEAEEKKYEKEVQQAEQAVKDQEKKINQIIKDSGVDLQ